MALLPVSPVSPEIPNPGASFPHWAAMTAHLCNVPSQVPVPSDTNWQQWGRSFAISQETQGFQLPDPERFAFWHDWAVAVKRTISGA